jgi:hypothetical protein
MKYFQITDTNVVIGYEDTDIAGIDYAISQGWQDVTNEYPQPIPYISTASDNKATAVGLLQATDWTQIPSVSDFALSNPYLSNKLAFDQYRNNVRQYAVYPVEGNITWPTVPTENWVKV